MIFDSETFRDALRDWGWDEFFARGAEETRAGRGLDAATVTPARVISDAGTAYRLQTSGGEVEGLASGALLYGTAERPVVGDWVLAQPLPGEERAVILAVIPRRNHFARRAAGKQVQEQLIAANVDTLFIVQALGATDEAQDLNARRLERYLVAARAGGTRPVVLINKSDLRPGFALSDDMTRVLSGCDYHFVSATRGDGITALEPYLHAQPVPTVAFVGSSGVGKSTIINALLAEHRQHTHAIRESDGRGRHTTTRRELFRLPGGGLLIDTPGMREFGLWAGADMDASLSESFADLLAFAAQCRFDDCRHHGEPGCAVEAAAAAQPELQARLAAYRKLERELAATRALQDEGAGRERRAQAKRLSRAIRQRLDDKYGYH